MKKSLSIVLCVVMIALTFCSCKFVKTKEPEVKDETTTTTTTSVATTEKTKKEKDKKDEDKTTDEESITVFVTDKNGEVVTKKDGTPKTEKLNLEELQKQFEEEMSKQQSTTKKAGEKTTKKNGQSTTSAATPDLGTQGTTEDLLPEGTKIENTTLMKSVVEPVLKSGTYTIKGNIKAAGQAISAVIAFRNDAKDYSATVSMGPISVRCFSNNGKYYMALPTMGRYAEISGDDMGEIGDISESFKKKDAKYVKTTKVKDGKNTYTCEEYKTETGTAKYYFNSKNEWKRMELVEDGAILVWEITSFTKSADKLLFEVNKLWIKDNTLAGAF
ncbi:MAG: hypothetical protein MJ147_03620 [Clostridia bacterium]|nr:hypothetical protein [Clostridia bacterium]